MICSGRRLPAVARALLAVVPRGLAHDLERPVGDAAAEMVARGELAGLAARPQRVGRRMGLLQRARPDGDGPVLEVAALPAERLRLRPGLEDQLHALVGALPRLLRVEVVGHGLVRRAPQKSDDQATLGQGVEHGQLLGHAHRIAVRDDGAEQGDRDLLQAGRDVGRRDDRGGGEDPRRVVVLGHAHPVEAELLDVLEPLDHALVGLGARLAVIHPGRHRPLGRQGPGRTVAHGFEERDFHGSPRTGEMSMTIAPDVSTNRPRRLW